MSKNIIIDSWQDLADYISTMDEFQKQEPPRIILSENQTSGVALKENDILEFHEIIILSIDMTDAGGDTVSQDTPVLSD